MIQVEEYAERRKKVLEEMDEQSIAIIFAGQARKMSGDAYKFEINKNFYYLTGIDQEGSILILVKVDGETNEYLFVQEKLEKVEKWTGIRLSIEQAKQYSGIDNVLTLTSFEPTLKDALSDDMTRFGEIKNVYLDLEDELKIDCKKSTNQLCDEIVETYKVSVIDIHSIIMSKRMVKSKAEVELIVEAIKTTELGLKNVLRNLEEGHFEYNLKNVFEFAVKEDDDSDFAFDSIVASGKNAVILHYPKGSSILNKNELVLLDVGARKNYYCGDISRTYPISGKFTEKQKIIYNIVLECNKQTAKFMRPGVSLKDCNEFAKNYLAEECYAKGLIASKDKISDIYYHSVSHHLGLDTHDGEDRTSLLVPGNVITCEPGLYIKELGIGIRIEDDVLITEEGSVVLSKDIIKEIDDIERILRFK